jgi:HEAT repeat protein
MRSLVDAPDAKAFDALVKALSGDSARLRHGASQALGALKDPRAVEPLVAAVSGDSDKLVRFQAGRALGAIAGGKLGEDGAAWKRWFEKGKQP